MHLSQDDKESLAELHEYLSYSDLVISPRLQEFSRISDRRRSSTSSIKSERRRSLPTNTSVVSIVSDYSIATPRPEVTDFQARRRTAAKLTQFFGVDYRELITDVLESIENGLEHERKRGTLNPDEVEVSLQIIFLIILVSF
jgi:predicted secreted protein